jgi:membrane protein DedA with SNARE-associated domain
VLQQLIQTWFHWVEAWGYVGIFVLMAMESSIFPVPSEIVVPPAAYWAAQGRMSMVGVVIAATAGSLFGSLVTYAVSAALGRPFVYKYGKYFLLNQQKIEMAERFITNNAAAGIFFARLLPVVRHLCSIPAGFVRMDLTKFTILTTIGAGIWCSVLAWAGDKLIGDQPNLINDPAQMVHVLKDKLHFFIFAVVGLLIAYVAMKYFSRGKASEKNAVSAEPPAQ